MLAFLITLFQFVHGPNCAWKEAFLQSVAGGFETAQTFSMRQPLKQFVVGVGWVLGLDSLGFADAVFIVQSLDGGEITSADAFGTTLCKALRLRSVQLPYQAVKQPVRMLSLLPL